MKTIETSKQYDKPYRPKPIALFNYLGRTAEKIGVVPDFNVDTLIANARRKTGLQDFGDEWFREPLSVLVESLNKEAQLTPLGKVIQKGRLEGALANRLRIEKICQQHPQIEEIELGNIIAIAGLQRTGTTTLHRLLAADTNMRALLSWEALNPAPLPKDTDEYAKARIGQAKIAEKGLAYLAPSFFAIHPVEHDAPEEDVLLLDLSFMSQAPEATMHVPSYAAWLETQDNTPAYQYLRKLMQVLLWQRPAKNWVLKTPHHMEYLDTLLDVFPEVKIVQTHRDPQKTMGSFCSMVAHGRGVFSDHVDAKETASHWVRKVRRMIEKSMEVRKQRGEEQFLDVSYYDLLKEPIKELEKIYNFAGIEFTDKTATAARQTTKRNAQHRYGRHRYDLEDFGLSRQEIENQFAFYRSHYNIPHE